MTQEELRDLTTKELREEVQEQLDILHNYLELLVREHKHMSICYVRTTLEEANRHLKRYHLPKP